VPDEEVTHSSIPAAPACPVAVPFGREPHHYALSDATRAAYVGLMLGGGAMQDHASDPDPHPEGKIGECFANALALCRSAPERLGYVEGIVRRDDGWPWEMHGYVFDRHAGHVIETTPGYEDSVAYRGLVLDAAAVDAWLAAHPEDSPALVWCILAEAIECAMPAVIHLLSAEPASGAVTQTWPMIGPPSAEASSSGDWRPA
jgi:hypothetical protein